MTKRKTNKEFLSQVESLVGDSYVFLIPYQSATTKIPYYHTTCGLVNYTTPDNFINSGSRCPFCNHGKKDNQQTFELKLLIRHGHEYKTMGSYIKSSQVMEFKHTVCNHTFPMRPNDILQNEGCPFCYGTPKKTDAQFKQEVYDLVGDEYTVLGKYESTDKKIKMRHNKCNYEWSVAPNKFLHGRRCPACNESHGERLVAKVLRALHIKYIAQKRFTDCRYKKPLPFDFYLPDYNLCIEYDGIQHFEPFKHFGGTKRLKLYKLRDSIKDKYCKKNNIKLLRIKYTIQDFSTVRKLIELHITD